MNRQQFNHNRTAYPLRGKHVTVECERCHLPGKPLKIQRYGKCVDCHADYHRGQFNKREFIGQCEKCHSVEGFTPATFTIEQHNQLDFRLEGGHLAVPCIACHKKINHGLPNETMQFHYPSTTCLDCHADPHGGQVDKYVRQNGCEACHSVASWHRITFDHNRTKFPLEGRHVETACARCHINDDQPAVKKSYAFVNVSTECQSCHDDIHLGQFREKKKRDGKSLTECGRCHTPTD
ncbi:hypothetical protein JW960_10130 [candidate division KSB1 bacterium]|nr:hypothetical protein [candidate division KSB1 bacterium]